MFGKLFASMYDGTLGTNGPWQALVTFQQLVVLASRDGIVDMTPEALARRTTIPLEIILTGLEALEAPDPASRTPDEDGRRIVRLSDSRAWGWRITNYAHYRAIRSAEDRQSYHRQYWRQKRSPNSTGAQHDSTNSTNSSKQRQRQRKKHLTTPTGAMNGAPKKPETWLTPIAEAHELIHGVASFTKAKAGEFARYWLPLVNEHGGAACAAAWTRSQKDTKHWRFNSPKFVAEHFAQFAAPPDPRSAREREMDGMLEGFVGDTSSDGRVAHG